MKKILILSLIFFTTNSFASGINGDTSTAPCDNETLSKYTGTANVEINWEPNVIGLKWFDGDTELNVATASQSCTYDGMITVPPAPPQKLGYTFNGWKIPKMDFGTIPTNENGTERWGKGEYNGRDTCWYNTNATPIWSSVVCANVSAFYELQRQEWKVIFNHGTLYGIATCSITTSTSWLGQGNPSTEIGRYCWCKATKYRASNTNVIKSSLNTLSWIYHDSFNTDEDCISGCANLCSYYSFVNYNSQRALFTPAQ